MIAFILILAPLLVGGSILASGRLRRHVRNGKRPVAFSQRLRWDTALILIGGVVVFRATLDAAHLGLVAQICGVALSAEFFGVAWLNRVVVMSDAGVIIGMRYAPWRAFTEYVWRSDDLVELTVSSRKAFRMCVPQSQRDRVRRTIEDHLFTA